MVWDTDYKVRWKQNEAICRRSMDIAKISLKTMTTYKFAMYITDEVEMQAKSENGFGG